MTDTAPARSPLEHLRPLAIDLFCGAFGWASGLVAEGWRVVGFDIEHQPYHKPIPEHCQLVLQDVLTLHGSQFKDAALIVASPPCHEYSYMAMPWSRAKAIAAEYRSGVRDVKQLTALFDACFRLQAEAIEAAGHFIPLVVENVRGAIPWVGRSRWNYGSFHLWGDVPALMPMTKAVKATGQDWNRFKECGEVSPDWKFQGTNNPDGRKQPGLSGLRNNGKGDAWFQDGAATFGSKSSKRKAASAMIARIPLPLAQHIAAYWHPRRAVA